MKKIQQNLKLNQQMSKDKIVKHKNKKQQNKYFKFELLFIFKFGLRTNF